MRILELEIRNIRGIRHLHLRPQGETTVIVGPNGSGKSTVVDALDFLLTGSISRLQGSGTGGITLKEHGKHVDAAAEDASVRAIVKLPARDEPVEFSRSMRRPKEILTDEAAAVALGPVLALAGRRQHTLTRRELLRYITADGATRAKAVEELLDLHELKPIQKSLTAARKAFKADTKQADANVAAARRALTQRLDTKEATPECILERINHLRASLDAPPLATLKADGVLTEVRRPRSSPDLGPRRRLAAKVRKLQALISDEALVRCRADYGALTQHVAQLEHDTDLRRRVDRQRLLEIGRAMVEADGRCPLCETALVPGSLTEALEERIEAGRRAARDLAELQQLSSRLGQQIDAWVESADAILNDEETRGSGALATWVGTLGKSREAITIAGNGGPSVDPAAEPTPPSSDVHGELAALATVESEHASSPEEVAWDTLTATAADLRRLEEATRAQGVATDRAKVASRLFDQFQLSRGRVVSTLYEKVRERFEGLYRTMNDDESEFCARLEPEGSSLEFTVDFHQRGQNPPHALHSEGHQDSMGLCLYLALAERLNQGVLDLVLLDDVVMSVDAGHRREFCRLLKESFPGRQFIITTHDEVWAKQLQSEGVVRKKQLLQFGDWDIAQGPRVESRDIWAEIDEAIARGEVSRAAFCLRRGLEEYFGATCERLGARVTYRRSGQYALEEVMGPAYSRLKELLKKGKVAANSWDNKDAVGRIQALSDRLGEAMARTNAERWAVNTAVHYNAWANLGLEDFRPVLAAMRALCAGFECGRCGTGLKLAAETGPLSCACGEVHVGLENRS